MIGFSNNADDTIGGDTLYPTMNSDDVNNRDYIITTGIVETTHNVSFKQEPALKTRNLLLDKSKEIKLREYLKENILKTGGKELIRSLG